MSLVVALPGREVALACVQEGLKHGAIFGESNYLGLGNMVKFGPPQVVAYSRVERTVEVYEAIGRSFSRQDVRQSTPPWADSRPACRLHSGPGAVSQHDL